MSIELSLELEHLVRGRMATGRYKTPSDVLTDALNLLEARDLALDGSSLQRNEIRERIGLGYQSLRAGKGVDGDAVFERIEMELIALDQQPR